MQVFEADMVLDVYFVSTSTYNLQLTIYVAHSQCSSALHCLMLFSYISCKQIVCVFIKVETLAKYDKLRK